MLFVVIGVALASSITGASVVDVLRANGETTLVSLITKAGLAGTLSSGGPYTIFAPSNAAFAKIPHDELEALGKNTKALANMLKYHVVAGRIHKADASNEIQLMTLAGTKLRINSYSHNHAVTAEGVKISRFDLNANNGVVHVIDDVMVPPRGSIVDIVGAHLEFTTLLSLVQTSGIASVLQRDNLTLFAPSDAAFAKLDAAVLTKLKQNKALLTEILEYHAVPHTEYSAGLFNREKLRTLDRHHDVIKVHASSSRLNINNGHVVKADMSATNGVIHEINHVLIPHRYASQLHG